MTLQGRLDSFVRAALDRAAYHELRSALLADAFRTLLAKLDSTGIDPARYWDWEAFERLVQHIHAHKDPHDRTDR